MNVGNSLKSLLARLRQQEEQAAKAGETAPDAEGESPSLWTVAAANWNIPFLSSCLGDGEIKIGTKCTNFGCNAVSAIMHVPILDLADYLNTMCI